MAGEFERDEAGVGSPLVWFVAEPFDSCRSSSPANSSVSKTKGWDKVLFRFGRARLAPALVASSYEPSFEGRE